MDVVNTSKSLNPLAPLLIPVYRNFWIAGLLSNIGTWMHETGAVWLMTDLDPRPEMVSSVRVAMAVPVFCLALPAGVWADRFERRPWLLTTQIILLCIAMTMAVLSLGGSMNPQLLLLLTMVMGIALILNLPAWQALTPELVPIDLIPSAVQAGSVSFNLARSIGPAVAGLIISRFGVGAAFLFNAISFLGMILVLSTWKPPPRAQLLKHSSYSFYAELRRGLLLVKNSLTIRSTLIRVFVFTFGASSLWSLLSLVATERMGLRERGFGICLTALGVGAVLAAGILPWIRSRISSERLIFVNQLAMSVLMAIIGSSHSYFWVGASLILIGACWMSVLTTLNATAQVHLPSEFRARGMSTFVMSFSLGMCLGSIAWGWLAAAINLGPTMIAAGMTLAFLASITSHLPLGSLTKA
jgi:predicted MFS family arabinose efflux permease